MRKTHFTARMEAHMPIGRRFVVLPLACLCRWHGTCGTSDVEVAYLCGVVAPCGVRGSPWSWAWGA